MFKSLSVSIIVKIILRISFVPKFSSFWKYIPEEILCLERLDLEK